MPKNNIVIIGNGFDLALGYSTRYKDFVESKFWPLAELDSLHYGEQNLYNYLYQYIQNHRDSLGNLRWIDLEDLIRQYVLSKSSESVKFDSERNIIKYDKDILDKIKKSFVQYLVDIVNPERFRNSIASQVVKQIADNQTFNKVYTFNYTPTENILNDICNWTPSVIHIHGQAYTYNSEIILGVGNSKGVNRDYRFFLKDRQKGYFAHDLNEDLFNADQIIFYGLSFGESDFVYFKRFFEETIRNHNSQKTKKIIHIFTGDDNSKDAIADAFEDSGLPMNEVYSRMDIRFYLASDFGLSINGRDPFEEFKNTMIDTKPKIPAIISAEAERFFKEQYGSFEY
ncbi:MAG: bacteriophage abortive infection AbiH family protein [Muribaculaceae bacterium]|nr:bacteriophage abortive infection AbiH family protein [Muribaculaceae bacterium]